MNSALKPEALGGVTWGGGTSSGEIDCVNSSAILACGSSSGATSFCTAGIAGMPRSVVRTLVAAGSVSKKSISWHWPRPAVSGMTPTSTWMPCRPCSATHPLPAPEAEAASSPCRSPYESRDLGVEQQVESRLVGCEQRLVQNSSSILDLAPAGGVAFMATSLLA